MGMRIHQLPAVIANQIAAGEVIERPASVVKELLENSLDAGANNITIEIGYGGLNQIKISDNGTGIVAEDLPLAVAAHATSKISKLDDLYAIDSMGFRGEALASISSVAKVTISSRPAHQEHAMMLRIQGSNISVSPCARNVGTTIDVVDLFFNAPVRKKFLKGEKLEFQAIEMVVKRFALSAPTIAITLKHNNKQVLSLAPALNEQAKVTRMAKIFGSSFMNDALYLNVEMAGMSLHGWLSGPGYQRSQNDRQWVYINQRMVKDKLINHALKQAYDGLLHPGRFPACLLYFVLDSSEVDVNVHPTKHEVRFQQPRLIHDFFVSQLSKALNSSPVTSLVDYECRTDSNPVQVSDVCEPVSYTTDLGRNTSVINSSAVYELNSERVYKLSQNTRTAISDASSELEASWVILNNQYILVLLKQQPYIVDIVALYQKWIQCQLGHASLPLESRPLLVPVTYSLPNLLNVGIDELKYNLAQLGVQMELLKENNILIRTVPIKLPYLDLSLFIRSFFELNEIHLNALLELLSKSQIFDPKYFSLEERMELNNLLLHAQHQEIKYQEAFKALTIEDCRMLLHV
ncbi:DNA mismatch repair endonuclease MutL [Legionella bononiensis]|uniref:DNA mismatch repair protein MutL n=1 Tax=Legionella bononiensis TaxID=2793102 RepID=A0ABS1W9U4_9GAMM|nr:DNA mismatch repair endonuclease MutL [Legionella bononiensis]MBL7480677.1 DNA mismatch repair endonuclease MutL [Legionella bononiensis]MBL7526124.1 DNA mismatch repair endonuclease MutL [Legionella bononiensis]MBL7563381.1 DNA mismatch repair endonuclease MutL [Legionella bononiensis]